jgi:methionyl-tRNA formyltransferase
MAKSVIVLGKGTLAIRAAEWFRQADDYEIAVVVPVVPEPTWTDSLIEWCREHDVPFVESGRFQDALGGGERVDLAVSIFYDKIIRPEFIDSCQRIVNLHNGPLPRYRGVSPINWALKNGERSHGVTIHEITPGIDDGPIVSQVVYSIYPELDEVIDVYERAQRYGWALFQETMPILDSIVAQPQDESEATYYAAGDNDRLGDRRSFTRAESVPA